MLRYIFLCWLCVAIGAGCGYSAYMCGIWWPTWGYMALCSMMLVMGDDVVEEGRRLIAYMWE
jgi:hypothetical protein